MADIDASLLERARERVAGVADDPEGRYHLCDAFYRRYGFGPGTGYGASELCFLRWEIERGVLNPISSARPGSPWWREVNAGLLFHPACAAALHEAGSDGDVSGPVKTWLSYLRKPSPQSWYRAHNASTVEGYLTHADAARVEGPPERTFMNVVLYRLLYAQALVESDAPGLLNLLAHLGLGRFLRKFEALIASPRSPAVHVLVHLPDFYPRHYPLTPDDIRDVMDRGHSAEALAEEFLDRVLVSPSLTKLYALAARWLDMPAVNTLVAGHTPVYPGLPPAP
jgi:hypothetical protein